MQALVGREERAGMTTLDALRRGNRTNTLIKIDVEGAELDVIAGAQRWMHPSNLFLVEVHRRPFLDELSQRFREKRMPALVQVDQRPLPLLAPEVRDADNWWLVSELPK